MDYGEYIVNLQLADHLQHTATHSPSTHYIREKKKRVGGGGLYYHYYTMKTESAGIYLLNGENDGSIFIVAAAIQIRIRSISVYIYIFPCPCCFCWRRVLHTQPKETDTQKKNWASFPFLRLRHLSPPPSLFPQPKYTIKNKKTGKSRKIGKKLSIICSPRCHCDLDIVGPAS